MLIAALGLGLLTSLSRIPFRSRYLFSWDSANFALALERYNVAFHQPQPPGYPLYVAAAALVRPLVADANAAYVTLSIVASGLAVTFLTLCASRLYGRRTALLAGFLLATSSVFWSQGEVAYPYAFLACFTSLVAWLCTLILDGGRWSGPITALTGAAIGVAGGFRTELLAFLTPLWLYAALRRPVGTGDGAARPADVLAPSGPARWAPPRVRSTVAPVLAGAALMVVAVTAWYVPMVVLSGGWQAYQAATGGYYSYFIQTTSGAGKLLLGLLENTRALVGFLYNGLGLALLPMVYFLGRFFAPPRLVSDRRARFLAIWLAPPLVFYVTVHLGNPGYVLSVVPALCIYAAEAIAGALDDVRQAAAMTASRLGRDGALAGAGWVAPAAAAVVLAIGAANTALFLLGTGEGRRGEIRQIDRILGLQTAYVRQHFPPASTLVVAYDRSRQYRYYLPEYRHALLFDVAVAGAVTDTSRYWERRTTYRVAPDVHAVLFPDLHRNTSDQPGLVERLDLGGGVELYLARVRPGDEVRYGYQYATAVRPA